MRGGRLSTAGRARFPRARFAALAWLAVWLPLYLWKYGWHVFLNLCDVAVILTCVGLWTGSARLLSSQALSSLAVDLVWDLDLAFRALGGRHLVGGTEYMWDARWPLWLRLLSAFHLVLPVVLIGALRRSGRKRTRTSPGPIRSWDDRGALLSCTSGSRGRCSSRSSTAARTSCSAVSCPRLHALDHDGRSQLQKLARRMTARGKARTASMTKRQIPGT
jgi:hypothetical protein